jgi:hypothetical protein
LRIGIQESFKDWLKRVDNASRAKEDDSQHFIPALLSSEEQVALDRTLGDYVDVFAQHEFDIGQVPHEIAEHKIRLYENQPLKSADLRSTGNEWSRAEVEQFDFEMVIPHLVKAGVIRRATALESDQCPFYNREQTVPRKQGLPSFVSDLRETNANAQKERTRLLRMEEVATNFQGCQYFSIIDISFAFWNIPLAQEFQSNAHRHSGSERLHGRYYRSSKSFEKHLSAL